MTQIPNHQSSLFVGFSNDELAEVTTLGTVHVLTPNDIIVNYGDTKHDLYVILDGRLVVSGPDGEVIIILTDGGVFGEIAFLHQQGVRSANVIASEHSVVLSLTLDQLTKLKEKYPDIAYRLLWNLAKIVSRRLEKTTTECRLEDLPAGWE